MPRRGALLLPVLLLVAGCRREPFAGPLRLLETRDAAGALPRAGALSTGGETRPALLAPAAWKTVLPARALLTYGIGVSWAGAAEQAPGWAHFRVRAGGRVLDERTLNPREARGFRDVSLPLEGLGGSAALELDVRLTDREGVPIATPPGLVLGIAEPTLHDLADYGRARSVILVSIDTVRRDHVGAYGYAKPTTPCFDALGGEGVLFDDAVSTSSWTLPAHLSMLTSVDPAVHGGTRMERGFARNVPTLAQLLKDKGFATEAVTSHLYVSATYGLDAGFDHLDFRQDRKATEVADRAIAILDRVGDRPFFLFLHLYDPHWHYDPPLDTLRLFETGYAGSLTGFWQDFSKRDRASLTPADLAHLEALYDGEIRYADNEVGRVLEHMKARGLERGTLVVMTSDHGEEFLDHGSWEHQKTLYEEVVRIPLALRGPGIGPRRESAPVSLLDVAPTILAWLGEQPPPSFRGRNLLAPGGDTETYGETEQTPDGSRKLFLRAGAKRWKAILSLDRTAPELRKEEWYDLAADPAEQRSAPPPASISEAIRKRALERWREDRARGGPGTPVSLTPEQRERLRALGYVAP
jgi:arylsulfatase A-like enzyme